MTANSPVRELLRSLISPPLSAVVLVLAAILMPSPVSAQAQNEGDYLYNVTMLQAAPGRWDEFVAVMEASFDFHEEAGDPRPFWIRHSQGDIWDFMVIYPMDDFASFHSADRVARRAEVWGNARGLAVTLELARTTAYHEEWFARSVDADVLARRFDGMDFYHVEIMAGFAGERKELIEERRMENNYLGILDRQENLIFVREGGSNWDVMTLGFYETMQTYAAAAVRSSPAEQDAAAQTAGFEDSSRIGPYLRSLIARHHDTLAVRMK